MLVRSDRHGLLLRPDDALVLVIDMQEPFLRGVWERDKVLANVALLVDAARVLRVPIVPTLQYAAKMGGLVPEVAERLPPYCIPFDKLAFSCAADEACASEIQRSGRRQILLCGVETHICVSQTAHDLVARGYQVHVAVDAVSSREAGNKETGLERMRQAGVVMSSAEMATYEMLTEAGTPEFKEILKLVR